MGNKGWENFTKGVNGFADWVGGAAARALEVIGWEVSAGSLGEAAIKLYSALVWVMEGREAFKPED